MLDSTEARFYIIRMTLRELRYRAGLTQAELAARADCEQRTVSQIELGQVRDPRSSTLLALARVLRLRPETLFRVITETEAV